MTSSAWSPTQYGKFAAERTQPFLDLLALVQPIPGGRAVDLGCGTGELTRLLHERSGAATDSGTRQLRDHAREVGGACRRRTLLRAG
jgi:trans-aconitate 2-methyltransferase